ncbi:MAG: enoyl-CoA hydratase-related protein [Pseudomonadota bacterium]
MTIHPNCPVIVGVGQVKSDWSGTSAASAPNPISLASEAAELSLNDTNRADDVRRIVDTLVVVRTIADSVPNPMHPFGRCENPPRTIEQRLGLSISRAIYSTAGGDQPQALVNEFAEEIFEGGSNGVILTGAEATAAMKTARKSKVTLDWNESSSGDFEDRGLDLSLLTDYERTNGLGPPTQTYPAFENALRARLGLSLDDYRVRMSELLAPFSQVAETHPCAQFPQSKSSEFLATPSKDNYPIADPHLKWHVAQESVNQGAAVILLPYARARDIGIADQHMIWLHGHAKAVDKPVTERPDLSQSRAIELVLDQALTTSNTTADQIKYFDIYSCFPVVVELAAEALGLDWRKTVLTVTGGLPFFGGAGNNYSMHAIATMVERLRDEPHPELGLVLANGGFISKEAAGVYSNSPQTDWAPTDSTALQQTIDDEPGVPVLAKSCEAEIESYTVTHGRFAPSRGYIIAKVDEGRVLARCQTNHRATLNALSATPDAIGETIRVTHRNGANFLLPSDSLGSLGEGHPVKRTFEHVNLSVDGHILEVSLNRPASMNSLHSAAHHELAEIWDEFENSDDLWVAIITGEGDKAFCSGNDLKVTAKGGDMSVPRSGFGGLCNRFDRTKPIIAAVNGVAMGGGLEIVLACDLAVADPAARFALPEVKVGLFAAAGGVQRLTRQIGRKAAMKLILTGRHVNAEEAAQLGIINDLSEPGGAMEAARALAKQIEAVSPSAVRASKQALNVLEQNEALEPGLSQNSAILRTLMRTRDFKEGVTAFAEKRDPKWTNS